jgi:hypothetical protein
MLVEAQKGVLQCDTYYGDNSFVLGVSGSIISNHQRDLIIQTGVNEVIIAFDKEYRTAEELDRYIAKIKRITQKFMNFCNVYVIIDFDNLLDYKDSPTDKGSEVLETLMKNKILLKVDEV